MLVRVRSKDGIFRITLEPADDVSTLLQKLLEAAPQADLATLTLSSQPRGGEMDVETLKGNTLSDLGISHGHLLYASYKDRAIGAGSASIHPTINGKSSSASMSSEATPSTSKQPEGGTRPWHNVKEDEVDLYWTSKDGMIPRKKDPKFCRHGDKAMCDYCMPLEPYDQKYQAEHNIKHLSFHSLLKKLDAPNKSSSKTWIPPLEEPNYSVRTPCPSGQHPPFPAGICTKCQPSAITLQSQEFRLVDHVEFSHPQLIENLLAFWRSTGSQRFGFLLGHYEPYDVVPMGIKAVVEAIHEPPQEGETDGLTLGVPWEDQARIERLARDCNLQIVGQIYTDLTPADPSFTDATKAGQVLCKRHKDSFFLSSLEVLFAGHLQASNPNPSRYSMTGKFGSKFVTCVLSGTEEGAIDVSAYQISEQGVGMIQADMLEASVQPSTVRVQKREATRYVPEVFHRYKNKYGIDVKESAAPTFPVEYLLVTLTHGFPNIPSPRFLSTTPFAIENRPGLHDQDLSKALGCIYAAVGDVALEPSFASGKGKEKEGNDIDLVRQKLIGALSDWHLLAFLGTTDILDEHDLRALCVVATSHDPNANLDALLGRPGFQSLLGIARANGPGSVSKSGGNHEVVGDYAGDDYIPPEAMEGYIPPSSNPSTRPASGTGTPSQREPSSYNSLPRSAARPAVVQQHEEDALGYDDDADMNYEDLVDDEDGAGYDEDETFDDAASDLSTEQRSHQPPAATRSAASAAPATAPASVPSRQRSPMSATPSMIACPHCTFENSPGSQDCDVCGLPLRN